ncbi:nicotinate-nucleotide adenylyltransferase [Chryseomicrobium palamuruense]|uniref:Probable nicotinate-nucleotide adenylyltransferase n=1 Tax=Chryseomicrobium palamuruense TaxID=682973 RepID=A0ABV8UXM6_9BACL
MKQRIGILGGTFNPPHYGHLLIANEVKQQLALDELVFLPNALSPFKQIDQRVNDTQRVEMLSLALSELPESRIETLELSRGGISYTYDTMVELSENYPNSEIFFIIGADQVEKLSAWYRIDELIKLVTLVAVPRPGYKLFTSYDVQQVMIPMLDVSSTELRKRLANRKTVKFLMPDSVATYCEVNRLYDDA